VRNINVTIVLFDEYIFTNLVSVMLINIVINLAFVWSLPVYENIVDVKVQDESH